jgi:pentose-5-phosphate-3-epimerase/CBS domain-containing protein
MKISASIYSYKNQKLEDIITDLDRNHIDMFHIDCNDDPEVFRDIERIRKISTTPVDLHIISAEPERYYDLINEYKIEYVQFQYENLKQRISPPKNGTTSYGLGIISTTPCSVFDEYKDDFSFILFMTTIPGESGGQFQKENFRRIRKFRNKYQDKELHVDGGINDEVSFILRNMGVSSVVSGSYIANNYSVGSALLGLKLNNVNSHYRISDFMIDAEDLPILDITKTDVKEVLITIEKYKLGFVFYHDENRQFAGLSSNADVRKGLLKNLSDLNAVKLTDIVNPNPVSISEESTITDMLNLIKSKNFIISFLPVINKNNEPVGGVTFFNMIRSEK